MSPSDNPNTTPSDDSTPNTSLETPITESTTSADQEALQTISQIEAEGSAVLPELEETSTDTPTEPTVSIDSVSPAPLAAPVIASVPISEPTQASPAQPTKPKKPSKNVILVILLAVLVVGAAIAGYFAWQSMQPQPTVNSSLSTEDTKSGEALETVPTDTAADVEGAAASFESEADNLDDASYEDKTLSDTTLYEN